MNILDRIIAHKKQEVEARKRAVPVPGGEDFHRTDHRPFAAALRRSDGIGVIAEFKKASPSRGVIREDADPVEVAGVYEAAGASAISVLTDRHFFQGSDAYLSAIHSHVSLPVLRKDFIIDPYQIREASVIGADAVLLIASVLPEKDIAALHQTAERSGLACLVEVHRADELTRALNAGARIIGVNNRDLTDFSVDLQTSLRLKTRILDDIVTVSESGIHNRQDVLALQEAGFDAILVGESLMQAPDAGAKLRELLGMDEWTNKRMDE